MAPKHALESSVRHNGTLFIWSLAIKECVLIVVFAFLFGGILNYSLVIKSFDGTLRSEIQEKQLAELKAKAKQLNPEISFIDLVSAKKLYDEGLAIFLDARSPDDYEQIHIAGAINLSVTSVVRGDVVLEEVLPEKEAILITYCDGGECDISVELAKELIDQGYSNVYVLGEGYPGWEAAGYPIERSGV